MSEQVTTDLLLRRFAFRVAIILLAPVMWLVVPAMYLWQGRWEWIPDIVTGYRHWWPAFKKGGRISL